MPGFGDTPKERIEWSVNEYHAGRCDLSTLMGNLNSQIALLTDEPWQDEFWDLCLLIEEVFAVHLSYVDMAAGPGASEPALDMEGAILIEQAIDRILGLVENDAITTED